MIIEYRVDLIVNPYHQVKEVDFHDFCKLINLEVWWNSMTEVQISNDEESWTVVPRKIPGSILKRDHGVFDIRMVDPPREDYELTLFRLRNGMGFQFNFLDAEGLTDTISQFKTCVSKMVEHFHERYDIDRLGGVKLADPKPTLLYPDKSLINFGNYRFIDLFWTIEGQWLQDNLHSEDQAFWQKLQRLPEEVQLDTTHRLAIVDWLGEINPDVNTLTAAVHRREQWLNDNFDLPDEFI